MPVVPATLEVEVGELWSEVSPGKSMRLYVKNKLNAKGLGCVSNSRALVKW
jgi:hypothetical protein